MIMADEIVVDEKVVSSIEQEIAKLDETEKKKLVEKLSGEFNKKQEETKSAYQKELEDLQKKYNVSEDKRKEVEKKYSDFATQIDQKLNAMTEKFDKTWGEFKPDRTGFANTSSNPFKDKKPSDIVKEMKDPRQWGKDEALKTVVKDEFFSMINA